MKTWKIVYKPKTGDRHLWIGLQKARNGVLMVNYLIRDNCSGSSTGTHVEEHVVHRGGVKVCTTKYAIVQRHCTWGMGVRQWVLGSGCWGVGIGEWVLGNGF